MAYHYLQWDNIDLAESALITYRKHNLIYNKSNRRLLMGGTTNKDEVSLIDKEQIQTMYKDFSSLLEKPLPDFNQAKLNFGVRQKGKKRMPFYGLVEGHKKIYSIHSLYKNGYTLGWELGKRVVNSALSHL